MNNRIKPLENGDFAVQHNLYAAFHRCESQKSRGQYRVGTEETAALHKMPVPEDERTPDHALSNVRRGNAEG